VELSTRVNEFLQNCENCGRCKQVCPFLDTYGTPDKIIAENPEKVFLCSNCEACNTVCKENLQPSEILFEMKGMLLKNGSLPVEVKNSLTSTQSYALRGHRFPFSHYTSADIVFWPGCGVSGTSPELVKKTVQLLTSHLNKKVGLVLDCCFDPLYQLGDVDSVKEASERIHHKLGKHKVTHVITGCTNCRKTLSQYLPDIKVEHIFETLMNGAVNPSFIGNLSIPLFPNSGEFAEGKGKGGGGEFFLHHPCPSFRFDGLRQYVKTIIKSTNGENPQPSCCGHGGGVSSLSQELSEKFTDKVIKSSNGNPVVTYCMGCKGKFMEKGQKAYHLLELMAGVKPIEKPVSSGKKWVNRFFLASGQRFNVKKLMIGFIPEKLPCEFFRNLICSGRKRKAYNVNR
jgi:Fe-S oxidoreductase